MEMSPEYAAETARVLSERGYACETSTENRMNGDELRFEATRYRFTAPGRELVLEVLTYPDGELRYYLEIVDHHGLNAYSFELDSWKYRDEYVEFRYYTIPETGGALTFKLDHPEPPSRSPDAAG